MKQKNKKEHFLECYQALQALVCFGNLSTGKGAIATSQGQSKMRADERAFRSSKVILRAGQDV